MSERTCETCRWWNRISAGEDANDGDYPRGICTRNPPVIFQGVGGIVSAFPDTDQGESCGEWRYFLNDIPPAPQSRPAETKASGPQPSGTGKPKSGEVELRVTDIDPAGRTFDLVGREFQVSRIGIDPMEGVYTVRLSPTLKPAWQALWELGAETRQPVAYCIQCADDDPKVHSLSFDKAALGKIVTRHGGKVVPLYLGKP